MSVAIPFVLVLLAGAFAAYHRLRLATWVATSAALLTACWLFGANHVAVGIAAALIAIVALPLLLPGVRKRRITAPLLGFYTRILPPLSETERTALESFGGKEVFTWARTQSREAPRCRPAWPQARVGIWSGW